MLWALYIPRKVIIPCVQRYLRVTLSFRDLAEVIAERGLSSGHTMIIRWMHHCAPGFERLWNRFAQPVRAL